MLIAEHIRKSYGAIEVIRGLNLSVRKAEIISIVGESGAGKSTLLHVLSTLDKPDSGTITLDGIKLEKLSGNALSKFRNKRIGFVFQFHHLLPEFTALENISLPALIAGKRRRDAEHRAHELLELLGVERRAHHRPSELSGGEQQRVAIARALINNPAVLFADEPSGNLDSKTSAELHSLFLSLRDQFQQTFVIVTHNPALSAIADRQLRMLDGVMEG